MSVPHNDVDAFECRDRALARGGRQGPALDCGRKALQHGWRPPRSLNCCRCRPPRCDARDRRGACHRRLGPQGRGLAAAFEGRDNVITLHTCGKALGTVGGFVLAPESCATFWSIARGPSSFPPRLAPDRRGHARGARNLATDPERRERLARLVQFAGHELRRRCGIEPSGSQILPVIVGADQAAVALAAALQRRASTSAPSARRPCPKAPRGCASR